MTESFFFFQLPFQKTEISEVFTHLFIKMKLEFAKIENNGTTVINFINNAGS